MTIILWVLPLVICVYLLVRILIITSNMHPKDMDDAGGTYGRLDEDDK